jgi:tetratricopeptide (TPR) repeat protein/SAM-dependent methyltransferase
MVDQTSNSSLNNQDPPKNQLRSLITLYTHGQLMQALEKAESLVARFPNSAVLNNILGSLLGELGQHDRAVKAYNQAIAIKPDYAEAYFNIGITLHDRGQLEEAITAYSRAVAIRPDYAESYYEIGNARIDQGRLGEAITSYKQAVAVKPDYAEAYNNMGNAFKAQGRLEEASKAYRQAITRNPDYAEAFYNIGIMLQSQGQLEGAMKAYQQAVATKPDYAEAYNNMGNALIVEGQLEEAITAYSRAISIKPDYAAAHYNIGITFHDQGQLEEAIKAYSQAVAFKPDYAEAYYNLAIALQGVRLKAYDPVMEAAFTSVLDHKTLIRPKEIAGEALGLLKRRRELKDLLAANLGETLDSKFPQIISVLNSMPLLIKLMAVCPLPDLGLERILSEIRSYILRNNAVITGNPELLKFQSALALQCFTNEYIYNLTDSDAAALNALEAGVEEAFSRGCQPDPQIILCLASYRALNGYDWSASLQNNRDIQDVYLKQIVEPTREEHLKPQIEVFEEITNKISNKVREQYEENPYPRWVNLALRYNPASISEVVKEVGLKLSNPEILSVNEPKILVAGCGTGQHAITTASRFKDSEVIAVDLSLASLAYAKRKTGEFDIDNINYIQADILKLRELNRQFDIIESVGVLHHMDDPIAGWKVLVDCLNQGGLMRIGLYSELARASVINYRAELARLNISPTEKNITKVRAKIVTAGDQVSTELRTWGDFFSTSELRDLIFHVQEHRFTLLEIKDHLGQLGLEFCGFEAPKIVEKFKAAYSSKEATYDLLKWNEFEQKNPNTFDRMYQFWCQKST